MSFTFTPQATKRLQAILSEKGSNLALRIEISRGLSGPEWRLTLEPVSPAATVVSGVPVIASAGTLRQMEGLIIDWVMTPDGPGLGVYDKSLIDHDVKR